MQKPDCIFCKLANGEISTAMVYENDQIACFKDASPQAQTHVLIVPKQHYHNIEDLGRTAAGRDDAAAVLAAVPEIAAILGVGDSGYRVINNCGSGAGQTVFHVHFHLLSDPKLKDKLV